MTALARPQLRPLLVAGGRVLAGFWVLAAAMAVLFQVVDLEGSRPVILLETFTPYVFLPGYALLIIAAVKRRRLLAALVIPLLLFQLVTLGPHFISHPPSAAAIAGAPRLIIYDQNVQGALNPTVPLEGAGIRASHADIVVLEETTPQFRQKLYASAMVGGYRYRYAEGDRTVLSVVPLQHPAPLTSGRTWIDRMGVTFEGRSFTLYALHMPAPLYESAATWNGAYASLQRSLAATQGPVIVVGDFNATMSHHALRNLLTNGLSEVDTDLGHPLDRTWPAPGGLEAFFGGFIRIDHILVRRVAPLSISDGPANGSDHRSVLVTLALNG